jgi:hypothetical protein
MNHDEDESWFLEICFCANFLYACTAFLTLCHEASSFVLCADANIFLSLYYQNSSNVTRSLTAANITRQLRNISSMLNTCDLFHPFCLFGSSDESVLFFDLLLFLGILVNVWHDWYGTTKVSNCLIFSHFPYSSRRKSWGNRCSDLKSEPGFDLPMEKHVMSIWSVIF